jgi:hypothetical protein
MDFSRIAAAMRLADSKAGDMISIAENGVYHAAIVTLRATNS